MTLEEADILTSSKFHSVNTLSMCIVNICIYNACSMHHAVHTLTHSHCQTQVLLKLIAHFSESDRL